jgi:hypothetical protein
VTGNTGSGSGSECGSTCLAHGYLATRPSTPSFNGFARPVILRVFFLEERQYVLGTIGSPEHQ